MSTTSPEPKTEQGPDLSELVCALAHTTRPCEYGDSRNWDEDHGWEVLHGCLTHDCAWTMDDIVCNDVCEAIERLCKAVGA